MKLVPAPCFLYPSRERAHKPGRGSGYGRFERNCLLSNTSAKIIVLIGGVGAWYVRKKRAWTLRVELSQVNEGCRKQEQE